MKDNMKKYHIGIGKNADLCLSCKGTRHIECPRCRGTGITNEKATLRCWFCGGSGMCQCPTCKGRGKKG